MYGQAKTSSQAGPYGQTWWDGYKRDQDGRPALRRLLLLILVFAIAAFGAVIVRNVTDVLAGIAGRHPVVVELAQSCARGCDNGSTSAH